MDSCLLCLENKDNFLDTIEINSIQWKSLDITNILEKHFWSLNTIQPDCWICLECWQKVDDFHNFYTSIEEAHINYGQIKIETQMELPLESAEEDLIINEYETENLNTCIETEIVRIENLTNEKEQNELLDTKEEIIATEKQDIEIDIEQNILEYDIFVDEDFEDTQDDYMEYDSLNELSIENDSKHFEVNNENIAETQLQNNKLLNKAVIEFSSDDNDSPTDSQIQDINRPKRQSRNKMKCAERTENRSIKEMDDFIAKEYGQINCDMCDVPLKDFAHVTKHYQEVHNQKGYVKCCKIKFQTRGLLVDHLNMHLNPDYFKCTECGKVLQSRHNLRVHKQRLHRPENVEYEHKCEECGKTFAMNFMLRIHKLTHVGDAGEFPCEECGKIFRADHLLKRHVDVVHLKKCAKICAVCGKTCDTNNELRTHMTQHEPQTPVNCDVCGLRLTNKRNYLIHRRIQHPEGGKKDHHCHVCNKISPSHRALMRHINVAHKKGYDHKCTVCGKGFKFLMGLREHMATHTGDVLYKCDYCPKTYNSRANYVKHRKTVHPKEWAEHKYKKYYGTDIVPNEKS